MSMTTRPKNFETISFADHDERFSIHIVDLKEKWPEELAPPTIIVNCTPDDTLKLPTSWLASPTGGLALDVSRVTLRGGVMFFVTNYR
jgi:hypothetical protein